MLKIKHLKVEDYKNLPWKNHRGTTSEIAIFPENADFHSETFKWRISSAQLASSSSFSQFPGYDRTITLLEGDQMELNHDCMDKPQTVKMLEAHEFKGEWMTTCEVGEKPVRDFNLMVRRGKITSKLEIISPSQTPKVLTHAKWIFIFCATGSVEVRPPQVSNTLLKGYETLMIQNDEQDSVAIELVEKEANTRVIVTQLSPAPGQKLSPA